MTVIRKIRTALDMPNCRRVGDYKRYIEINLDMRWPGATANWEPLGEPIAAHIQESTWVIKCPDCPEQIIYEPGHPFYCPDCQNVKNSGSARPVTMPTERSEIERLLCLRDMPANRNWLGETVAALRTENIAHGVDI